MSPLKWLKRPAVPFWSALVVFFALHLYKLSAPPNGYHQWRESDTAAVILNYYQEDMNFLHPRINQRGASSGITGSELPVYNYASALLYHLSGPSHASARLLTVLAACLGLWLFRRIVTTISGGKIALYAVWAMAFSPLYFFYSFKIMPDIWMLVSLLGAVYLFLRYCATDNIGYLAASALCLILSACIKPLGLSVYLVFVYMRFRTKSGRCLKELLLFTAYIGVTFGAVYGWFSYARHVNEVYASGGFYMGQYLHRFIDLMLKPAFFKKLFLQWPFEIWIGWVLTPVFGYGLYRAIRFGTGKVYLVWILASYIVFALVSSHSHTHDYYTLIIVPPLAALTGTGLNHVVERVPWRRLFLTAVVLLVPLGAVARTYHRIADVAEFEQMRSDADRLIPRGSLVMIQDTTTAIRLYQVNRNGWPLRFGVTYSEVERLIQQGAEYLVIDGPIAGYTDSLRLLFDESHERVGEMYCYSLRK
ncbi:MAG: glycosyltransferase family 39 protein [Candidatus Zixiibacteriota bacterium]|nr:MAG: glycosyltransferase family 39 protein [candidate division Zixibacteria bacterium]